MSRSGSTQRSARSTLSNECRAPAPRASASAAMFPDCGCDDQGPSSCDRRPRLRRRLLLRSRTASRSAGSSAGQQRQEPVVRAASARRWHTRRRASRTALEVFDSRCSPAAADAAWSRRGRQAISSLTQATVGDPRASIDSTFIVCTEDRAFHPDAQRVVARRCTRSIDLEADHSPGISAPTAMTEAIAQTAAKWTRLVMAEANSIPATRRWRTPRRSSAGRNLWIPLRGELR